VQGKEQIEPVVDELTALLCNNKVVLIRQMPLGFGVVLLADRPLKRSTIVRVPQHKDLRQLSKAVEDVLAGVLGNVD
jgi:hypothetical protein